MQEPGVEYTKGDHLRLQMIAKLCKGTVLDVGAGDGILAEYYPKHLYTGVDENPRGPLVKFGDAYNLHFEDWSFETVVLAEVLEHMVHPVDVLAEVGSIATKQIVISVPNPYNLDQIASVLHNKHNIVNVNHVAMYGDNEIRSLCRQASLGDTIIPYRTYTKIPGLNWLSPIKSMFGEWNIYVVTL